MDFIYLFVGEREPRKFTIKLYRKTKEVRHADNAKQRFFPGNAKKIAEILIWILHEVEYHEKINRYSYAKSASLLAP